MILLGEYFNIERKTKEENNTVFSVVLNSEHKVYQGHFPGMPVCPGVCNVQMIKECLQQETGKRLLIDSISQCKFSSVITPLENKKLLIHLQIAETEDTYKVRATVTNPDNTVTFIDFKGEFVSKFCTAGSVEEML